MKTGMTLTELAQEIERQSKAKEDFIAPTNTIEFVKDQVVEDTRLKLSGHGEFPIVDPAHEQFASRLDIPRKYYDRMRIEAPDLFRSNVNHWLSESNDRRMLRTMDGNVRSFLSDRYRPLDYDEMAEAVLPIIGEMNCTVMSAEITPKRLYLKVVAMQIEAKVSNVGDVVNAGIVISNSEVGCGSVRIEPFIYTLKCKNGMIANDSRLRKFHVGKGMGDSGNVEEFYRTETRLAEDRAFWLKARDVVRGSLTEDVFGRIVSQMSESTRDKIEGDPVKAVEVVQKKFGFHDFERVSVLRHLIEGGDLSRYGLLNAVTRTAEDLSEYERATDFERTGGDILELSKNDWKEIAQAA